jgi:hypothetical protein
MPQVELREYSARRGWTVVTEYVDRTSGAVMPMKKQTLNKQTQALNEKI